MSASWSDAELSLLKGDQYHEYSNTEPSQKTLVSLTYASTYHKGRNFFFIDAAKVSGAGPSYAEIYGEYYHTSSLSYSTGFIKDVGFTGGVNYGVKNNELGANPEVYLLGPTVDLNLSGFVFFLHRFSRLHRQWHLLRIWWRQPLWNECNHFASYSFLETSLHLQPTQVQL